MSAYYVRSNYDVIFPPALTLLALTFGLTLMELTNSAQSTPDTTQKIETTNRKQELANLLSF
jgi:hypothetical protein